VESPPEGTRQGKPETVSPPHVARRPPAAWEQSRRVAWGNFWGGVTAQAAKRAKAQGD